MQAVEQPEPEQRRKSNKEIQEKVDEIGRLLAAGYLDRDIMDRLKLKRTQYYVYRAKLFEQSAQQFERSTTSELVYQKDLLKERLTRLFRQAEIDLTETRATEGGVNNKDRASTYMAAQNIAINLFKLEHEGLRVLSTNGWESNRYLRRARTESESGRRVHILPGYTEEGGGTSTLIRQEGEASDQNTVVDESTVY